MVKKQNPKVSQQTKAKIHQALAAALQRAEQDFQAGMVPNLALSEAFQESLDALSENAEKASTGFTNIVTSLAIKVALPEVDIRYHQVQIQERTPHPAGFNFRGLSEKVIYPWLNEHRFAGAKSGWQTRTFERPKPYLMDYEENIDDIKIPFLTCFDEV